MPISHAHLRSFHAVATHQSFTRAAESLHVTQPTLSGQVKELEERYGIKLFIRHGRKVELTEIGQSAFEITRKLFKRENEVEQLFLSARNLTSGELRVGADSPYIITPLLAQFQRLYPGISISIQYGNSEQVTQWLESGDCDIAILPNVLQNDKLKVVPLEPDELVVFISRDHPWNTKHGVKLKDVVSEKVILREKGSRTRSIFENAVQKAGMHLDKTMEIRGREGVREAVAAGFGIGIISVNELGSTDRFNTLQITDARLMNQEYLVCLNQTRSVRVTNAFFDIVSPGQLAPTETAQ